MNNKYLYGKISPPEWKQSKALHPVNATFLDN